MYAKHPEIAKKWAKKYGSKPVKKEKKASEVSTAYARLPEINYRGSGVKAAEYSDPQVIHSFPTIRINTAAPVIPGILEGGKFDLSRPKNLSLLTLVGGLTGAAGAGLGYGAAKLSSPSLPSIKNMARKEKIMELERAANEVKSRMALVKQRSNS